MRQVRAAAAKAAAEAVGFAEDQTLDDPASEAGSVAGPVEVSVAGSADSVVGGPGPRRHGRQDRSRGPRYQTAGGRRDTFAEGQQVRGYSSCPI